MIKNYFISAVRNLRKYAGYTAINLLGLAVGLTVVLQIYLFVSFELSYDNFHRSADNLYRIVLDGRFSGTDLNAPVAPAPMAAALIQDFPEVESVVRLAGFNTEVLVRKDELSALEKPILMVDSTFFDIFGFRLLSGNPATVLTRPRTLVLTETLAKKYFGLDDPIGETLVLGDTSRFEVTGIVSDPPPNTHVKFSLLRSLQDIDDAQADRWISNNYFTYLRLRPGSSKTALEAKLPAFFKRYAAPQVQQIFGQSYEEVLTGDNRLSYSLQRVRDVHLRSNFEIDLEPSGDIQYVHAFIAIALFILLLACINFMNLATARSASRALEVGIRKAVGSSRGHLILQFLSESVLLSVLAMILAVGGVFLSTPLFSRISGQPLDASIIVSPISVSILLLGAAMVGILAGSYPALYLSSFRPARIIQSHSVTSKSQSILRNSLVVFQFGISVALLLSTFIVGDQLAFIQAKRLGFDKDHILVIERASILRTQSEAFKERLRGEASILAVGGTTAVPGGLHGGSGYQPEGFGLNELIIMAPVFVDNDYVEAMGIELFEGRDFSTEYPSDSSGFVINEASLKEIGWNTAVGKTLGTFVAGDSVVSGPILGVIRDYNYASLRTEVRPMALQMGTFAMPNIIVRFSGNDLAGTLRKINGIWGEFVPQRSIKYSFLNETFDELFDSDRRLGSVFSSFAMIAIFIAGLGLFGLGLFATEQRTKEIGIRKALGATVPQVLLMLTNQFTRLVLFSIVIALPIAYFGMLSWLNGFAFRTDVHISSFVYAAGIALIISWLTVGYQSVRAARTNPVVSLRHQ